MSTKMGLTTIFNAFFEANTVAEKTAKRKYNVHRPTLLELREPTVKFVFDSDQYACLVSDPALVDAVRTRLHVTFRNTHNMDKYSSRSFVTRIEET